MNFSSQLRECEYLRHEDDILVTLNYNLSYLAEKRAIKAKNG